MCFGYHCMRYTLRAAEAARSRRRPGWRNGAARGPTEATMDPPELDGSRGRLTAPLLRVDGVLRPTTWDVALDTVARGFASAKADHGPDAIGMFACSKTTNELNYAAQ